MGKFNKDPPSTIFIIYAVIDDWNRISIRDWRNLLGETYSMRMRHVVYLDMSYVA